MELKNKETKFNIFDLKHFLNFRSVQMRTFHITWFAFFLCFFAWFGIAPLMKVVREELQLTDSQVGWAIIASVAATVVGRVVAGWLCDRFGPRLTYTWLLVLGSIPVMCIGFAQDATTFIAFRLLIGLIGASFVITQYHTSQMFAPNCVGTANAVSAGWGNLGGGVTQLAMPLLLTLFIGVIGVSEFWGWRLSMVIAGAVCLLTGLLYYRFTVDTPDGNFKDLRAAGRMQAKQSKGSFTAAAGDSRVWALFVIYGVCFGLELTIYNVAALYFVDYFEMGLLGAGLMAGLYGAMNIFSRPLGGLVSDRCALRFGLKGRVTWLLIALFCEGLALMLFSRMGYLPLAMVTMLIFAMFVQMSNGATFAVVPFVNKKSLGSVAGIVGAGGNVGAVAAGFLFKGSISWPTAFLILGSIVTVCSFLALLVRFSPAAEQAAAEELESRLRSAELLPA